jgi:hypothetical protein
MEDHEINQDRNSPQQLAPPFISTKAKTSVRKQKSVKFNSIATCSDATASANKESNAEAAQIKKRKKYIYKKRIPSIISTQKS